MGESYRVHTAFQRVTEEVQHREKQLTQAIIQEEQSRLKELEQLNQSVNPSSSLVSTILSQAEDLSGVHDDLVLLARMKKFQEEEAATKQRLVPIQKRLDLLSQSQLKTQQMLTLKASSLEKVVNELKAAGEILPATLTVTFISFDDIDGI